MQAVFVDVENEFAEIAKEVECLAHTLNRLDARTPLVDSQDAWEVSHICASATEKIYTGCERIMAKLASDVDNAPIMHSDGWHSALLRRIANPFPDVRLAVLSNSCYRKLDRLRAFRHRERNTYGINLDFEIVIERSREAVSTFADFHSEVEAFFRR